MSGLTQKRFWRLVDATVDNDIDNQIATLRKLLGTLKKQELIGYVFNEKMFYNRANVAKLWDFASVVFNGMTEEQFNEFRVWMIYRGKTIFKDSLKNPEILVPELRKFVGIGRGDIGELATKACDEVLGVGAWELPEPIEPAPLDGKRIAEAKLETTYPKAWREYAEKKKWLSLG